MKKLLSMGLLGTSAIALTGCLGFLAPEEAEAFVLADYDELMEEEVEIDFWHAMGADNRAVLDELILEFNEDYPNISITHAEQGGYDDLNGNIISGISAGTMPNLALNYPDHIADYLHGDAVLSLDPFIEAEDERIELKNPEDFVESYYEEGRSFGDDTMYSLPFSKSTEVMFYNADVVDADDVPTTWSELENLKTNNYTCDVETLMGYDSYDNAFITLAQQFGGEGSYTSFEDGEGSFNFVNDDVKDAMKYYKELSDAKILKNPGNYSVPTDYGSDAFTAGETCFTIGSSAGAKYNASDDFTVGTAPIPQHDSESKAAIQQGPNISILNTGDNYERLASWLFMNFLTSTEVSARYAVGSLGYMPVRESSFETDTYKEFLDVEGKTGDDLMFALTAQTALDQKDFYFTNAVFTGTSASRAYVGDALEAILSGTKDVDKALQDAYDRLTA